MSIPRPKAPILTHEAERHYSDGDSIAVSYYYEGPVCPECDRIAYCRKGGHRDRLPVLGTDAAAEGDVMSSTKVQHDFDDCPCPHPDCGGGPDQAVHGEQCGECGHYFAPSRLVTGPGSEPYCRQGMGHNAWMDRQRAARLAGRSTS